VDESSEDFNEHDFSAAWSHPHAFALIKMGIQKMFMNRDDFSPENPFEELSERVTATGMIKSAHDLGIYIEVRYGWEMLDDDNIIMHSCFGTVEKVDISINAEESGFLMKIGEDEYGAFSYRSIFWVCKANESQFK
jgi:hypothetical protein